jgi:hypothetical protein
MVTKNSVKIQDRCGTSEAGDPWVRSKRRRVIHRFHGPRGASTREGQDSKLELCANVDPDHEPHPPVLGYRAGRLDHLAPRRRTTPLDHQAPLLPPGQAHRDHRGGGAGGSHRGSARPLPREPHMGAKHETLLPVKHWPVLPMAAHSRAQPFQPSRSPAPNAPTSDRSTARTGRRDPPGPPRRDPAGPRHAPPGKRGRPPSC